MRSHRKLSGLTHFVSHNRGASAVEFGLLAVPFFLVLAVCMESGVSFLAEVSLIHAVEKMGRQVRTGEVKLSNLTATDFRSRMCTIAGTMFDCSKLNIDLREYASYKDLPDGPPVTGAAGSKTLNTAGFQYMPGAASKIMALQVYYEWPLVFDKARVFLAGQKNGTFLIGSTVAFKNENFE